MVIVNCNLFEKEIEKCGVSHYRLWKNYSALSLRVGKVFRKISFYKCGNINPDLYKINSDSILVFDNGIRENTVLKWMANTFKGKRLIFYYWNPVVKSIHPLKIPKSFELWSYSPSDCEKYGMKYNSTFYFKRFILPNPPKIDYDLFFAGKDKGRGKKLSSLKIFFEESGLKTLFYITATHPRIKNSGFCKQIPYEELLLLTNKTRCILDYYFYSNAGLSLRAMEGLFLGKKIITNNETYKNYDFYNNDQIYIIGERRTIIEFLKEPISNIDESVKERYLFEHWIRRF